ncbi:phosphonate ABC transporter, permease protein PhnE [Leucobacter aridicollis]|uniref:Phosphonate transport system permease protein n=1 Tax=Leucobacter aridicollis TaxID=283878 RepID=A0A852REF8_9MICO|nr:phosphonate ABC transporter, permease protein PhnE [Leucobacter aridicollis]MBL3683697.1 phosphonate ABC transporter, permease protein PhnE [Leucobacter aridicollis]NYD26694.1 phosphonate transport system permease protein [Leucobacter aridicollis]
MTALALPEKPRGAWRGPAIAAAILLATVVMCLPGIGIGADLGAIARNWQNGADKIFKLLQPDWSFFPRTIAPFAETLQMAVIATAVGAGISLPLSFLAARNTAPNAPTRIAVRAILNVVRAVPDLLYAAILVAMVGVGALPGILALVLFNVGILVKLVSEAIDTNDVGPLEAGRAVGATPTQINRTLALPDAWPAFANQTLYVFELNVRASTVLGLVGAGGLGLLIDAVRTFYRYDQLSLIILEILIIVIALDALSSAIRRRLV